MDRGYNEGEVNEQQIFINNQNLRVLSDNCHMVPVSKNFSKFAENIFE
jgi:hypothetical protein